MPDPYLPSPGEIDRVIALRRGAAIYDGSPDTLPLDLWRADTGL